MVFTKVKSPLLLSALFIFQAIIGQITDPGFEAVTKELIENTSQSYSEIDQAMRKNRSDTLQMKYFLEQSAKENYWDGTSYAYNQLGVYYRDVSDFSNAVKFHEAALQAADQANNIELRIMSLNMLGAVYRKKDGIKAALDYYQEALKLAESIEEPNDYIQSSINNATNGIGNVYKSLGQYDLAINYFRNSLDYESDLGNTRGLAINYQNIAECKEAQGQLKAALENYEASLRFNEKVGSERIRVVNNYGIAHVYVHLDMMEEALEKLESILPAAEKLGDPEILSSVYIHMGWTLTRLKQLDKAKGYLDKGLDISRQYQLLANLEQVNSFLHDLWLEQGDYEKALNYYKASKSAEREISNDRDRRYVYDVISRSEVEKRSNQIEMLAKENEIVKLRLRRNKNTLLVSALLLALFTIILYILYRQYQLKSDKKLLTLEQSMLRSQMNPHFLFNSLNSIKLYIINNETKNAVHYLNKFSKLIRKILEASSLKEIPLAEELETVELYMNIENIRFSNEIEFDIKVDEGIDPHIVKIPSLILQPFLENALWHGLSSKEGEKSVLVHVKNGEKGFIQIAITDNGVGREKAAELKESKVLKRKSVGIDITKERLDNFSKDYQNSFDVKIFDLFDDQGKASGTNVVLHIPTI
ncbi:MAG: tetratricopeptide repeat protein [Flavobacteriaceae bacterium]